MKKPGPRAMSPEKIQSLINVALGKEKADLVVHNGSLVNVYTGEIQPDYSIAIKGDRIAHVGKDVNHTIGPDTRSIDATGKTIIPGFIDSHTHMCSIINPVEYMKFAMLHGTTTIITEIQEVAFPLGFRGIKYFINYLNHQPIKIFFTAPPLVTLSKTVDSHFLTPQQLRWLLKQDEVVGLGESYWLPTIRGDKRILDLISESLPTGKRLEGHSSGARNNKLIAYFNTGITSCHESINMEEALEKLRLGVNVMIREGGIRRELAAIAKIQEEGIDLRLLSLVSDGINARILFTKGYMDHIVQNAMNQGLLPTTAIQAATINPAAHFALDDIVGGIAPGKYADVVVIPSLATIKPEYVISNGQIVVQDGLLITKPKRKTWPSFIKKSFHLPKKLTAEDFRISANTLDGYVKVRVIEQIAELVTRELITEVKASNGIIDVDTEKDIIKVAAISTIEQPGTMSVGLLKGFGLKRGAFASSASWDSGNIVVVGANDADMASAVNRIAELYGGSVVCCNGQVLTEIDLSIAGDMSPLPLEALYTRLEEVQASLKQLGSTLINAPLSLVVLTSPAVPHLRISEAGLFNVREGVYVDLFVH